MGERKSCGWEGKTVGQLSASCPPVPPPLPLKGALRTALGARSDWYMGGMGLKRSGRAQGPRGRTFSLLAPAVEGGRRLPTEGGKEEEDK